MVQGLFCNRPRWASLLFFILAACQPAGEQQNAGTEQNDSLALPPVQIAEPAMDRADLLLAVARAQSAAALGVDDAVDQRQLDGRRLEFAIRFGCPSPVENPATATLTDPPFAIRFDQDDRTLRLRATPDLTRSDPWVAALGDETIEAAEGFWVYRPWLLTAGCPQRNPPPEKPSAVDTEEASEPGSSPKTDQPASMPPPSVARGMRVGIAQFFTDTQSRTGRRENRSYEATKLLAENETPSAQGYNLILSGRLVKLPGGKVITCRTMGANMPPECVVSAEFDRVRLERPGDRSLIADWRN